MACCPQSFAAWPASFRPSHSCGQIGAIGGVGPREEKLPGDRVLRRRSPLEVGTRDVVRAAAVAARVLPAGVEEAHEGLLEVVARAGDRDVGGEVLIGEPGAFGAGEDHRSAAAVLADQGRVLRRLAAAGRPQAEARRGEGAGVDRLNRCLEEIHPLEKERPLLGKEEREALVGRDLSGVRFDLREVGVHRRVDRGRRIRNPLGVDAAVELRVVGREGAAEAVARRGRLVRRDVGRHDVVRAHRESGETDERPRVADEAARVARQARGEHLVAEVARPVAVEQDPPLRRIRIGVAQGGEGDADLEHPAGGGDPRRAVPEVVGRVVLARGVVRERVVLDAAGVGEKELRRVAVVLRVDDDAAVVGVRAHVVAVAERRADRLRIGLVELEGGVEEVVVVGEPGDAPHLGRDVVAGIGLQPVGDRLGRLPRRVGEIAVDDDRRRGAGDADLRPHRGEGADARLQESGERTGAGGERARSADRVREVHVRVIRGRRRVRVT